MVLEITNDIDDGIIFNKLNIKMALRQKVMIYIYSYSCCISHLTLA